MLLTGDRIWCRRHVGQGSGTLHVVEYWGESGDIVDGRAKIVDPHGPDLAYLRHPMAWNPLLPIGIAIDGVVATTAQTVRTYDTHAAARQIVVSGGRLGGNLEVLIHARHPMAYVNGMLNCDGLTPNGAPVIVTLSQDGHLPVSIESTVFGCRCAVVGALPLATIPGVPLDPETAAAVKNSRAMPWPSAVVGVTP